MARQRTFARRQPPFPGGRTQRSTGLLPEIDRALERLAHQYDVSPSWVRATLLADALGIGSQPSFRTGVKLKLKKVG